MPNDALDGLDADGEYDLVVVDDDTLFTMLLTRQLRRSSRRYRIFNDSTEALAYLEEATPSALLVDLRMPGLSGVELLEALGRGSRASPPNLIVCSSCLPPPDTCAAIEALGAILITKDQLLKADALPNLLDGEQARLVA